MVRREAPSVGVVDEVARTLPAASRSGPRDDECATPFPAWRRFRWRYRRRPERTRSETLGSEPESEGPTEMRQNYAAVVVVVDGNFGSAVALDAVVADAVGKRTWKRRRREKWCRERRWLRSDSRRRHH